MKKFPKQIRDAAGMGLTGAVVWMAAGVALGTWVNPDASAEGRSRYRSAAAVGARR